MTGLSKRQVSLRYGMNENWVDELISRGVFRVLPGSTPLRPKIDPASLDSLREVEHYVECLICGSRAGQLTTKHLRSCSGIDLEEYGRRYPSARILSALSSENKVKTEEQKVTQSKKLKERFQTPQGEITRSEISEASRRMQAGPYREKASNHLRAVNRDPQRRRELSKETKARWDSGALRTVVEGWHSENLEESLRSARHARGFVKKQGSSGLHLRFKTLMEQSGILGFQTEYRAGFYDLDEARPDLKIAVEIDGCWWHGCPQCGFAGERGTRQTDSRKNGYLAKYGWIVLRLKEHDINADPGACLDHVRDLVFSQTERRAS